MNDTKILLRQLGNSSLKITPIGLGTWQFSKGKGMAGSFWAKLDDSLMKEIVQVALDEGINWFDTAELYGKGESEKALSRSLETLNVKQGEVYIATKWWPVFRTARSIGKTIGKRQEALHGFPIDLYQIHNPYSFSSISSQMKEMGSLIQKGLIKNIGVSNFSASQMKKAHDELQKYGLRLISNQVKYSLLDRGIEFNGVLNMAKELGISIIAYSPLKQGVLTGKFHEQPELLSGVGFRKYTGAFRKSYLKKTLPLIEKLKETGARHGATPAQVALNWAINYHGDMIVAIPGASKVKQAKDNAGSMKFMLSEKEMEELSNLSLQAKI